MVVLFSFGRFEVGSLNGIKSEFGDPNMSHWLVY